MPFALAAAAFLCAAPVAVDGDTLRCAGGERVRLASIDAPEMKGHCRRGRRCTEGDPLVSKAALTGMMRGGTVRCRPQDRDHYGRIVARCFAGGMDLSCAMVVRGYAVERYGRLICTRR